jgi:hypothetical protein
MSKVYVSLFGGLGNQLFQYSIGRSLALRNRAQLIIDLSWFNICDNLKGTTPRKFELSKFNIVSDTTYKGLPWHNNPSLYNRLKRKFFFFSSPSAYGVDIYKERNLHFDKVIFDHNCPIWLDGYWQSYKYFESIEDVIRKEINTPEKLNAMSKIFYNNILKTDSICIHIRRGDYVKLGDSIFDHTSKGLDYYNNGVITLIQGLKNPHAYIFSDDPDWVKGNFKPDVDFTIMGINSSDQDLWLMAACQRFLIANSSFSWWAAWLGTHKEKKVIAPKKWIPSLDIGPDLFPDDWMLI